MIEELVIPDFQHRNHKIHLHSQNSQKGLVQNTPSKTCRPRSSSQTYKNEQSKTQRDVLRERKKKYSDQIRERNLKKLNSSSSSLTYEIKLSEIRDYENINQQSEGSFAQKRKKIIGDVVKNVPNNTLSDFSIIEHSFKLQKPQIKCSKIESTRSRTKYNNKQFIKKHKKVLFNNQNCDLLKKSLKQIKQTSIYDSHKTLKQDEEIHYVEKINQRSSLLLSPINQNQKIKVLQKDVEQNQSNFDLVQDHKNQLQKNMHQLLKTSQLSFKSSKLSQFNVNSFIVERLIALEQQVFNLRRVKNNLQLKIHSMEIKTAQQIDYLRKRSAKEISNWKNRYNKVLTQNLKLKNKIEGTLQMQISKDQDIEDFVQKP